MLPVFINIFTFLAASLVTLWLISLSTAYQFYQQIISILIVLIILIASRIKSHEKSQLYLPKSILLFLSSLVIQVIVVSSGGFYSPLLILLHIFAIGAIFILSSSAPIFFLVFSLGVLIFHISYDRNLYQFFQNDPWTVLIYAISILIVIPLALYLSHSSRLKDKFNNFLKNYIAMSEKTQQSILTALSNMVIITSPDLKIISVNIAVERLLRVSLSEVQEKLISEVLVLKDKDGNKLPFENLPVQAALTDKATHFAEGYSIETKAEALPKPITIQIRPLTDGSGQVSQIVFVLTDPLAKIGFNTHPSIKEALKRRDQLLDLITSPSSVITPSQAQRAILLVTHIEEDILTVQEMEDHPMQEVIGFTDLVILINQIIDNNRMLYGLIGNVPEAGFDDESKTEAAFLNLQSSPMEGLNVSVYSAPIDTFLVKTILEKILDLSVFIAGKTDTVKVNLSINLDKDIEITISYPSQTLTESDLKRLYVKDYPGIKINELQDSSGLEGYIAGKIIQTIQQPIDTLINPHQKLLIFKLTISKQPKIYPGNTF